MPRCACPRAAAALEPELRQALSRELKRGKVDCTLQQRPPQADAARARDRSARRSSALLARVRELATGTARQLAQIDLIELLRFPGVLREDSVDSEALLQAVRALFAATLSELAQCAQRARARGSRT